MKSYNYGPLELSDGQEVVFAADLVPFSATDLHLFDIGAYGNGVAGVKCILRIVGKGDLITGGNVSERVALSADLSAAIATYTAPLFVGGDTLEIVMKNDSGVTVTMATATVTYGWGSGVGTT